MLDLRPKPVPNCRPLYWFVPMFSSPVTYEIRQCLSYPNSKTLRHCTDYHTCGRFDYSSQHLSTGSLN